MFTTENCIVTALRIDCMFTDHHLQAGVLYPCVALDDLVNIPVKPTPEPANQILLLSINRFALLLAL